MDELHDTDSELLAICKRLGFYLQAIAIFEIITGLMQSLTIIGAIFGIPIIFSGLYLLDAKRNLFKFTEDDSTTEYLKKSLKLITKYFLIHFWIVIVIIMLTILYFSVIYYFFGDFFHFIMNQQQLFS